jgi:hypothetical protein
MKNKMIQVLLMMTLFASMQFENSNSTNQNQESKNKTCNMVFTSPDIPIQSNQIISIFLKQESHKKFEILNEFLFSNYLQNFDAISNIKYVPELRKELKIKIIKSSKLDLAKSFNDFSFDTSTSKSLIKICPWTWSIAKRDDRFPFIRQIAKCSTQKCEAKTIYDSGKIQLSKCSSTFSLMPCLVREEQTNEMEKWAFYLEEVPIACECNIIAKTFK